MQERKPTPKVTVIVPVYKVEKYIERCAISLFEQTLDDMEIIFVDDCSPDKSIDIVMKLLEKYPDRIESTRFIYQRRNGGIAAARKAGIEAATGEYVAHLDSDDWVDKDFYKSLYEKARQENADMAVGDETIEFGSHSKPLSAGYLPANGRELLKNYHKRHFSLFFHNKLIRTSIYADNGILPWEGLNMGDDIALLVRVFYHVGKIARAEGPLYHYNRCNEGSMTAANMRSKADQMIEIARRLEQFFIEKGEQEEFRDTIDALKYQARLFLVTDSLRSYGKFLKTFPESKRIAKTLDRSSFTKKTLLRFNMVRQGLGPVYILLFKGKQILKKVRTKR